MSQHTVTGRQTVVERVWKENIKGQKKFTTHKSLTGIVKAKAFIIFLRILSRYLGADHTGKYVRVVSAVRSV